MNTSMGIFTLKTGANRGNRARRKGTEGRV